MRVGGRRDPEIASLQRRALAALIDAGIFLPPLALAAFGGVELHAAYRRRRGADEARRLFAGRDLAAFSRAARSRRWQLVAWAAFVPIEIGLRNSRSPGTRVMGLRRVEARTGGAVSVRSAVIQSLMRQASRQLSRRVTTPHTRHLEEQRPAIDAELEELQRTDPGGGDARRRAALEVYRKHGVTPRRSCGHAVLVTLLGLIPNYLPTLWSERNQTLYDRVAGIIVVVEG